MAESQVAHGNFSRASEEWVAPFRKRFQNSCAKSTEKGALASLRPLVIRLFASENLDESNGFEVLELLSDRLESNKANCVEFRELGCIPLLVHHMATNKDKMKIQTICCHILASVADQDENSQTQIGEKEGITEVIDTLRLYRNDPSVCRSALASLKGLTLIETNRNAMIECGVLQCIITSLTKFIEDEIITMNAMATLARVVFGNHAARVAFGELGGILLVTQVLQRYESSPKMQVEAALTLRNLGFECPPNLKRMNEAHTIDYLFKGLRTHQDNSLVTNQVLAAVGNVIGMNKIARDRVLEERAYIAQIFRTLGVFADNCCLAHKMVTILFHLCANDSPSDRSNASRVSTYCAEEDGCTAIVTTIESAIQVDDALVAELAVVASELCVEEAFRQKFAESGGIRILLKCLIAERSDVIQKALHCLAAVLSGNDENKRKFSKMGGYPAIIEVVNNYITEETLIENCCRTLDIAADGQNATSADLLYGKEEVLAALLKAMKEFPLAPRIQEYSCSVLVKIASISEEDAKGMVQSGVRESVVMARTMHSGNTSVESLANQLLLLLVDNRTLRRGRGIVAGSSGNAGARLRSRSRTIGSRTRSRQNMSKSPVRRLGAGRRSMLAAKVGPVCTEEHDESVADAIFDDLLARKAGRTPKKKVSLDPILE